jgi:hypothetical protein
MSSVIGQTGGTGFDVDIILTGFSANDGLSVLVDNNGNVLTF